MRKTTLFFAFFFLFSMYTVHAGDWWQIEGHYSRVEYEQGQQVLAESLLTIAEKAIPRLARMHGLNPKILGKKRVRIILSDAPDISNGFALDHAVVIYARSSMYMPLWTATDPWYKMVLSHELAHYVTFRKIRRKFNFFGELANLTLPRWFYEGIAQYFAEKWNAFRGDLYLRNALFSGRLTYSAMANGSDGRLLYASANGFIRYLAATYGDSSLIKLMSYKAHGWYLDFDDAFQAVYGKKPDKLFPEFIRRLVLFYGSKYAAYPDSLGAKKMPEFGYADYQVIPLQDTDSTYLVRSKIAGNHLYQTAFIARLKQNRILRLTEISTRISTDLFISPDQRFIAYGVWQYGIRSDQLQSRYRWFVYDRESGRTGTIDKDLRARCAVFADNRHLILSDISADHSTLIKYNLQDHTKRILLRTDMPVGYLTVAAGRTLIFDGQRKNGFHDLFEWQKGRLTALTNDAADDRHPLSLNDSLILFNRFLDDNPAVAVYNLKKRSFRILRNMQQPMFLKEVDHEKRTLIFSTWDAFRQERILSIAVDSLLKRSVLPLSSSLSEKYGTWRRKLPAPVNLFPLPDSTVTVGTVQRVPFPQFPLTQLATVLLPEYDAKMGTGFFGSTVWMEALQRQILSASLIYFEKEGWQRALFALQDDLKIFNSNISAVYYHGPIFFTPKNVSELDLYRNLASLSWKHSFFLNGNGRTRIQPTLGASYQSYYFEKGRNAPRRFQYWGLKSGASFHYLLPTTYYPVLPRREIRIGASLFHTLSRDYPFSVYELNMKLAGNLFLEELGLKSKMSYIKISGRPAPYKTTGIDRFYEFDFPRDYTLTRSVRGLRRDIYANSMLWNSTEIVYFLEKRSALKLLYIPVNNLAVSAFWDWALLKNTELQTVYSFGGQVSFGQNGLRLAMGYALSKDKPVVKQGQIYLRLTLNIPQ